MDLDELKKTHKDYAKRVAEWKLYRAAFGGTKTLIDWGALKQHERESELNYTRRKESAYGYNFTRRLLTIINTLLSQKKPINDYGKLEDDDLYELFLDDCDFEGTDFETWLLDQQLLSLLYGHTGVLIDKAVIKGDNERTILQDIEEKNYPYLSIFSALNILDWEHERVNGKPIVTYLKLIDDCCQYRLWWRDRWETYEIDEHNGQPKLVDSGINPLGIIPFVWLVRGENNNRFVGVSAAEEVSRIDISIIRNMSQGEEVVDYSAFQILLKPLLRHGDQDDDDAGPRGIMEFDPQNPQSKPEWLKSDSGQPIGAILSWIDAKVIEMARMFNASAFFSQSKAAVSGDSRKREFQLMDSNLSNESKLLEGFQKRIIYFWLLWIGRPELIDEVVISRPRSFDISDKAEDVDLLTIAKSMVESTTFRQEVDKKVSRTVLPDVTLTISNKINEEIESLKELPEVLDDNEEETEEQ